MSFERDWVLLFLALPLLFCLWQWRNASNRIGLLLKVCAIAAVILALSEPRLEVNQTKVATAVLVDTSASTSDADLGRASKLLSDIERARGRHWMRVMPFARTSRELNSVEQDNGWNLRHTAAASGNGTDIEGAVRDGLAALPTGMVPRLLLISDGKENQGAVARASWLARSLGVPVDTMPLAGRPRPLLRIESISLPSLAFTGEKFPVDVVVSSPKNSTGMMELFAEGKQIGSSPVNLVPGNNHLRVHTALNVSGAVDISGVVKTADVGELQFEQAITLRRPRVLFLSQDPPGTESHLLDALKAAQFDVVRSSEAASRRLSDYRLVVLNNWDLGTIPEPRKRAFEEHVKQGGGLLVIGGERNIYHEDKKAEDALDRTLPAKLAPPRSPEGTCVVLIVDKSSSMEGRKMELARVSAIGVIDNLRPIDFVGVLIFDNSFQWAVPIRKAEDRGTIKRLVAGITPDGGTQIAPALAEAFRKIATSTATYRHIVLLTDGISEEGDSIAVARDASGKRVTISTVGLGQDVNRAYLEKIAALARGRSYFLTDPSALEQILLKDVMEHTGSTAIEKSIQAAVQKPSAIMDGVPIEAAPALGGYVKYVSKPGADTILTVDNKDPLLAIWQMGLGRAAVFSSDAKSRWAQRWIGWEGFDRFWINLFRDLLPRTEPGEALLTHDSATGNLIVEYKFGDIAEVPAKVPEIFAFGPDGFQKPVPVRKIANGVYRGQLPIGDRQGLYRVRPVEDSRFFPETGLYRQQQELTDYGNNEHLLRQVSSFTGGHFAPKPQDVFNAGGRSVLQRMDLWPGLLAAALILNLAELLIRKWRGIIDTLTRRRAAAVA